MSTTPDNTETGIAVLAEDVNTTLEASTWRVNGVALSENAVTMGGSKRRRLWPADVLREAADLLSDRPIVKNFHDLEGTATADDVIGRIEKAGYQDGVGLVFEGEISDESIARKVGNDFLEVSAVPGIASESYDSNRDAYVVEEISGFRDIAVVPDGADRGNEIAIGDRPAMAALSREVLSRPWDVLQESADDEDGTDEETEEADDGEDGSDEFPEPNTSPESPGLRAALEHDLSLTGTTPDRCKTIKDGASTIDPASSAARETLGTAGEEMSEMEMSGHEQASATALLGLGDDRTESWTVTRSERLGPDRGEDVLAQQILGSGGDADALQDEDRTPQAGDAVRWQSDSGGEREPDDYRYGVIVDGLQDEADDQVLVAVYQANSDGDGWENRNEQNQMSRENLEVVGTDGKASLPPVGQVT